MMPFHTLTPAELSDIRVGVVIFVALTFVWWALFLRSAVKDAETEDEQ